MLITKDFVMINFPKTGSTFCRTALKHIHTPTKRQEFWGRFGLWRPELEELKMFPYYHNEAASKAIGRVSQHGTFHQIPKAHAGKVVMSVVRDPAAKAVSDYEFRDWASHPFPNVEWWKERYPNFPDLSFEEYMDKVLNKGQGLDQPEGMRAVVGNQTSEFIRFFARDPQKTMLALRDDTDLAKDYDLHFPKIRFLHTEHLSAELQEFLLEMGYARPRVDVIPRLRKVNTTKRKRKTYWTPQLRAEFQHSERFFYQLFPEYLNNEGNRGAEAE
jgi:hypothetical protein